MDKRTSSIVVVVLGALLLLASLTADMTGLGDDVELSLLQTFGPRQMIGTVVGIVVLAVGAYLYKKGGTGNTSAD